jgi:hypothetical protein
LPGRIGPMSSRVEGQDLARSPSKSQIPWLRRAWDHMPSLVRRPILWLMRYERIRLRLLGALGLRDESDFIALNSGGDEAIAVALDRIKAAGVTGDYYEFGLYRGHSLWSAQQAADRLGISGMRFFGFDSFEGLPEIEANDRATRPSTTCWQRASPTPAGWLSWVGWAPAWSCSAGSTRRSSPS